VVSVLCVAGTRPEIIKMAPVIKALQRYSDVDLTFIHSGQHYDTNMSKVFIKELGLPQPDENIKAGSGSHAEQTAKILTQCEKIYKKYKPDLVLSEGDTNTVLASSLAAIKLGIPYGHVEAGLRCYDRKMPEETNRVIADHNAELCFAPTERNALNLAFEGIPTERIHITGNTIVDACIQNLKTAKTKSKILKKLGITKKENLILLTCHRAENTDNPQRLKNITNAIAKLEEYTIVFPVHPRTKKLLKKHGNWAEFSRKEHIICIDPLGYLDFLLLLSKSRVVLTDSGGVQEEAISLKVPCLTLRYSTERPETVECGANILVNDESEKIIHYTRKIMEDKEFRDKMITTANPYGDGTAGKKIAEICYEKILNGLEYENPVYTKRGAANYSLEDAEKIPDLNNSTTYKLICYFNKEGKPIFPKNSLKPEPKWKTLIRIEGESKNEFS
jgi:UDP-N-acetylglucosamine 2-epimerase (non-hydrolysing)